MITDPRERLVKALTAVRNLKPDEWKEQRDEIADDVAAALAGANADKADKATDRVVALLSKVHGLSAKEFEGQKADLEKAVDEIVAGVGPEEVVKNRAEHALAELLSNPRLVEALESALEVNQPRPRKCVGGFPGPNVVRTEDVTRCRSRC